METAYKLLYHHPKTGVFWSYCKDDGIDAEFRPFARRYFISKWNHAKKEDRDNGYGLVVFAHYEQARSVQHEARNLVLFEVEVDKLYLPARKLGWKVYGDLIRDPYHYRWPEGTMMCNKLRFIRKLCYEWS